MNTNENNKCDPVYTTDFVRPGHLYLWDNFKGSFSKEQIIVDCYFPVSSFLNKCQVLAQQHYTKIISFIMECFVLFHHHRLEVTVIRRVFLVHSPFHQALSSHLLSSTMFSHSSPLFITPSLTAFLHLSHGRRLCLLPRTPHSMYLLGILSPFILLTCPNHLSHLPSIFPSKGSSFKLSFMTSFLIMSLFVTPILSLRNLILLGCILFSSVGFMALVSALYVGIGI